MIDLNNNRCPQCGQPMSFIRAGVTASSRPAWAWRCFNYPCFNLIYIGPLPWPLLPEWRPGSRLCNLFWLKHDRAPNLYELPPEVVDLGGEQLTLF